eukprot:853350-Rhodomonas_salina.1
MRSSIPQKHHFGLRYRSEPGSSIRELNTGHRRRICSLSVLSYAISRVRREIRQIAQHHTRCRYWPWHSKLVGRYNTTRFASTRQCIAGA